MVLVLHIISIFFETGLGIWIFSKAFPKRESWGWQQMLGEIALNGLLIYVIFLNFVKRISFHGKALIMTICLLALLAYRYMLEKPHRGEKKYITVINWVIWGVELAIIIGIITWNSWLGYVSSIMALWGNMFLPFFLYKYYKCGLLQAYSWEVLYISTIGIVKAAYVVYIGGMENLDMMGANSSGRMHTYTAVTLGILICIIILLFARYFSIWRILKKALTKYKIRFLVLAISEACLVDFCGEFGIDGYNGQDVVNALVITIIVILVVLVLMIGLLKKSLETEKKLLDVRNDAIEQQYRELRMAYERNRCLVHDEKHMLQYIEECLRNDNTEKALEFLGECRENIAGKAKPSWTGIPTFDFVINMKQEQMDALSVDFAVHTDIDEIPMEDADFVVLLSNLFDNAIEAVRKCPFDSRKIELQVQMINSMFMIMMKNACISAPIRKKGRFLTSKADKENHGWGIESIKHIVKKYGGEVEFTYDDKVFQVQVMITCE